MTNHKQEVIELAMRFAAINRVEGDYLEFGVYQGEQIRLANIARSNAPSMMRLIGFDSFQGLPEPTEQYERDLGLKAGMFKCRREEFPYQSVTPSLILVEGWFKDTLNDETKRKHQIEKAAIVHIDCDLYEPTCQVLEFITPLLVDGSIVIFDDWYLFKGHPHRGQRKAYTGWMLTKASDHRIRVSEFYSHGLMAFVIHKIE